MKIVLLISNSLIAIMCMVYGILMISFPHNGGILQISENVLTSIPFATLLIPGILLALVVGGANMLSAYYFFQETSKSYTWAMIGGTLVSVWLIIQLVLLNSISVIHIAYLGVGLLTVLLAYQLKGKWAA